MTSKIIIMPKCLLKAKNYKNLIINYFKINIKNL